jgi:proteasome beta subunit
MITPENRRFEDLVGGLGRLSPNTPEEVHGTTVLCLRCQEGVLVLADRRATMGNLVMYDHADKILPLDDCTVVAISGSFARAIEIGRYLKHSFNYYRRMHLVDMSLEGKIQEITRTLSGNLPNAMSGIGLFIPILAAYDRERDRFHISFFDAAGASFQSAQYACAGSGSERIRGVFEYVQRTRGPWEDRPTSDALIDGMRMLDIASDLDSATGGFAKVLPSVRVLTKTGIRDVDEAEVRATAERVLG